MCITYMDGWCVSSYCYTNVLIFNFSPSFYIFHTYIYTHTHIYISTRIFSLQYHNFIYAYEFVWIIVIHVLPKIIVKFSVYVFRILLKHVMHAIVDIVCRKREKSFVLVRPLRKLYLLLLLQLLPARAMINRAPDRAKVKSARKLQ